MTRLAHYCCQCCEVFYSTSQYPEKCSLCLSPNWNTVKKYNQKPHPALFDEEDND